VPGKLTAIGLLATWLALGAELSVAAADGGTVRYSERRDDRLVTVFTAPTPLRTGVVDVSVLLQDANSGKPLLDVPVMVHAEPVDHAEQRISMPATTEAATNKLLRAAQFDLTAPGRWHVEVAVDGLRPEAPIEFDLDVAESLPPWVETSLWIGWPLAAIALFAVHQFLVHRRPRVVRTRPDLSGGGPTVTGRVA
jgi:hypothetical protein